MFDRQTTCNIYIKLFCVKILYCKTADCIILNVNQLQILLAKFKKLSDCFVIPGPIRGLSNRSELADCISEALDDCSECPTLTAEEQIRRRKCKSCVRNCVPDAGKTPFTKFEM